jgi:magnesium transporter
VIRAWRYRDGVAEAEAVDPADLASARRGDGTLLLVDVEAPTDEELDRITATLPVHPLAAEDLRNANQRTKLERYVDHWHVAVHDCQPTDHTVLVREVDVVFGHDWFLLVRQVGANGAPPMPVDDVLKRFERQRAETRGDDVGFALWALLDVVVDRYFQITELVDERLDDIEEIVFGEQGRDEIPQEVFQLRRGLVRFRRAAAPLREVIGEILRREVDCVCGESLVHFQDVYDHSLRIYDLVESQRDLLTGLLEAHLAVVSNRMNQVMKLTSSWGAIILGATLIAGIYGMNFRYMPELDWHYGYFFALGAMAVLTVVLYRMFRKRGWL